MKRLAAAVLTYALCTPLVAQAPVNSPNKLADTTSVAKPSSRTDDTPAAKSTAQPIDTAYTESIIKSTTDKMFLTEIVDHLPASAKGPTPEKILGYPIGTPGKLTYTTDQHRYYRELEKTTTRVKTFTAPEKSEGGKEQLLVVVSD